MKFKDVIHHYLGCDLDTNCHGEYMHPFGVLKFKTLEAENLAAILWQLNQEDSDYYCKPILRKLEDMTEEDGRDLCLMEGYRQPESIQIDEFSIDFYVDDMPFALWFDKLSPNQLHSLCSKSYDIFGLIESSEAIDAKTVTAKKGGDGE